MNVLALITARGGSKGIPRKNLAPCGGQPLLGWTCAAARAATCVTRAVISTDDPELASFALGAGVEAPFLRPAELATDAAGSIGVAQHAIDWLAREDGWACDVLVLLQPTSPMRVARHIDEAFAALEPTATSVVSVVQVPHRFAPWSQLKLGHAGQLVDYHAADLPFDRYRRQGQPVMYARNGPVVIITRAATIRTGSFYGARSLPYFMNATDSIDIDDRDDLAYADWLLRRRDEIT